MHDQISDAGKIVQHKLKPVFANIKSAHLDYELDPPDNLPATAYANPVDRSFPCHTKQSTLQSAAYLYGQEALGEKWTSSVPRATVTARLCKAAGFFGVTASVREIEQAAQEVTVPKSASLNLPDEAFIINETFEGQPVQRFPAVNATTTKQAAEALVRYRSRYPYAWRKKAAKTVLERAMAFECEPLDSEHLITLSTMAGLNYNDPKSAGYALLEMSHRFRGKTAASVREAASIVGSGAVDHEDLDTLCGVMDKSAAELSPDARPMVEDAIFAPPSTKAASTTPESVMLTTGNVYDVGSLLQAPQDTYQILGDEVSSAILDNSGAIDADQLAAVLPTLPRPDANVLDTALSAVNIQPRSKEAKRKGADSMFGSLEDWTDFLAENNSRPTADFRISAPLRHARDVHDNLAD